MAKLVSVSSKWTSSGSPSRAPRAARESAGSSSHASPVSVENSTSGPTVTRRPSCSAARLRMYSISSARRKSFPWMRLFPALRLMVLRLTAASPFGVKYFHGHFHPAVRRSSRFCIPLLRPYRHQRLSEQSLTAGTGGLLLSPGSGHSGGEQGSAEPANQRLQE